MCATTRATFAPTDGICAATGTTRAEIAGTFVPTTWTVAPTGALSGAIAPGVARDARIAIAQTFGATVATSIATAATYAPTGAIAAATTGICAPTGASAATTPVVARTERWREHGAPTREDCVACDTPPPPASSDV